MEVGYCESEYEAAMLDLLVSLGWTQSGGDELYRKYSDALILDDLHVHTFSNDFRISPPKNWSGLSLI